MVVVVLVLTRRLSDWASPRGHTCRVAELLLFIPYCHARPWVSFHNRPPALWNRRSVRQIPQVGQIHLHTQWISLPELFGSGFLKFSAREICKCEYLEWQYSLNTWVSKPISSPLLDGFYADHYLAKERHLSPFFNVVLSLWLVKPFTHLLYCESMV